MTNREIQPAAGGGALGGLVGAGEWDLLTLLQDNLLLSHNPSLQQRRSL